MILIIIISMINSENSKKNLIHSLAYPQQLASPKIKIQKDNTLDYDPIKQSSEMSFHAKSHQKQPSILQDPHSQNSEQYRLNMLSQPEIIEQQSGYKQEDIQFHKEVITNLWQYRYWKYFDYAVKTKDWLKVYAFIGEFKLKCLSLAKKLVNCKFEHPQIDSINARYEYKGEGEIGIYLIDGIIVRVAQQSYKDKQTQKQVVKNLHQQYLGGNILNNLIISLREEMPNLPIIKVPLQCLAKYLGYTFLFQADTLCDGIETLVNGPINITYQYQKQIHPILDIIGQNLNLKPFTLKRGDNDIYIPFSLTIEIHQINHALKNMNIIDWISQDSILYPHNQEKNQLNQPQYYLLNFSKLWPLFIDSNIVSSSGYLRPEVVLSWKKNLSNIVFTNVGFEKDEIGELELAEACKYVKEDVIKSIAKLLDLATYFVVDSPAIQQLLHENGVNIRFLGEIASKFKLECNRKIFEVEMVARTLKKLFFIHSREFEDENTMKQLYIDFLNYIFTQSNASKTFWIKTVYKNIEKYYQYEMNEYPPSFQGGGLLHALSYHCGFKMKILDYPFFKEVESIFTMSNITDVYGLIKSYDLETCELKKHCEKYKIKKQKSKNRQQAIEQLKLLINICELSCPEGTYSVGSNTSSFYMSELAECYRNIQQFQEAIKYCNLALNGIPDKHGDSVKPYCVLIKCYSHNKEMNRCVEFYENSLANLNYHLTPNHPLTISVYNAIGLEYLASNDPQKCEKFFVKSLEICEQSLGYMHITSGKILIQLANLPLSPEKRINFLLQAITILENIQGDKQEVKNVSNRISETYYRMGNITKQIHYAKKSNHWKMLILGLEKLNQHKMVMELCIQKAEQPEDHAFLIEKAFACYIRLMDKTPFNNLYKLFISIQQSIPQRGEAIERNFNTVHRNINLNPADVVKSCLNNLSTMIPYALKKQDFYMGFDYLGGQFGPNVRQYLKVYLDILAIVGAKKAEEEFTRFLKNF